MAWNALKSMDDRKFALENEVGLWKHDYFSTPNENRFYEGEEKNQKNIKQKGLDEKTNGSRQKINTERRRRRK